METNDFIDMFAGFLLFIAWLCIIAAIALGGLTALTVGALCVVVASTSLFIFKLITD